MSTCATLSKAAQPCAVCGETAVPFHYDIDLEGYVCRPCAPALQAAEEAIQKAVWLDEEEAA